MLMFSKSEIKKFRHRNASLRYGQAFYNYFKLGKITGADKAFCDKLYNADEPTAKAMIASRTDNSQ